MQSLEARAQYRNTFHCAYRIFTEEGILRFWTGTTPRLARLVVSFDSGYVYLYLTLFLIAEWWDRIHGLRKYHQGDRRTRTIVKLDWLGYSSFLSTELCEHA
jgi:hypothetical protein